MKIWTYILAFTVFFLSIKSGIDAIALPAESQETCCTSSQCMPVAAQQHSENHSDSTDTEMCNPFQACCPCLLICVSSLSFPTQKIDLSSKQYFGYKSPVSSQFIDDFWQPPQIV